MEAVAEDGIHLTPASHKHIANHTADFILTHVLAEITESGSQGKGGVIADHSGEDSVDNDVCINGDVVSTRLNEDESKNPFFRKLNKTFVERTKSTQGGALSRTNSTSTTHQVPFVATGKMRQQLSKLGYTLCDIKALSPSQAHYLTDRNLSKQQLLALQYRRQQDRERQR